MEEDQEKNGRLIGALAAGALAACLLLFAVPGGLVLMAPFIAAGADDGSNGVCSPDQTSTTDGTDSRTSTSGDQLENARLIDQAATEAGLSGRATLLALTAALAESDLQVLDHGDSAGPDSRGLFQQRAQGWGTEEQRMDPIYSAQSFLLGPGHDGKAGVVSIPGWQTMEPTQVIHRVQRNADPNYYTPFVARAEAIAEQASIDLSRDAELTSLEVTATESPEPGGQSTPASDDQCDEEGTSQEDNLDGIDLTGECPLDGIIAPGQKPPVDCNTAMQRAADIAASGEPWSNMCLALSARIYGYGASGINSAYEAAQVIIAAGQMHTDMDQIPRGALVFYDGTPVGNPYGHVAVYAGNGQIYSNGVNGAVGLTSWRTPEDSWNEPVIGWSPVWLPNAA